MPWTGSATTPFIHTGTSRDVAVLSVAMQEGLAIEAACLTTTDHIRIGLYATEDGRSCWECGIANDGGATNANLTIRRLIDNVPQAPTVTIAHGLAAGQPFTLRAESNGGKLKAKITASSLAAPVEIEHVNEVSPTFRLNGWVGIISEVNNATVSTVIPEFAVYTGVVENETLVAGCDGHVFISLDASEPLRIGTGVFVGDELLQAGKVGGKAYLVGEGRAKIVDPIERTVVDWVPNKGFLPGQDVTGEGTTLATLCTEYMGCAVVTVQSGADRGVYFSAVGDPLDFDYVPGTSDASAAFVIGPANSDQPIGEDIIAVYKSNANTLIVACQFSTFVITGHPVFGNIVQIPATLDSGASGANSLVSVDVTGMTTMHSPDGIIVLSSTGGGASNLTRSLLQKGITFPRGERDNYVVSAVRDSRRGWAMLFLTKKTLEDGEFSQHFIYDERAGYQTAAGGLFPIQFASAEFDPWCVTNWFGRPVLGCRDGYIREFSDVKGGRDDGVAFEQWMSLQLIDAAGLIESVLVTTLIAQATRESGDIVVRVVGGYSAEDVFTEDRRRFIHTARSRKGLNNYPEVKIVQPMADNAMLAIIKPYVAGTHFALEYVDCTMQQGAFRHAPVRVPFLAGQVCRLQTPVLPVNPVPFGVCSSDDINPPATGACTLGDGSCSITTEAACATAGGTWAGPGTACPVPGGPVGACWYKPPNAPGDTLVCSMITEAACALLPNSSWYPDAVCPTGGSDSADGVITEGPISSDVPRIESALSCSIGPGSPTPPTGT
jgi:hypothetical protein